MKITPVRDEKRCLLRLVSNVRSGSYVNNRIVISPVVGAGWGVSAAYSA